MGLKAVASYVSSLAGPIPAWRKIATLTVANFKAGTLSGGNLISTIPAAYTAAANTAFGGAMIDVTEAFAGPTLSAAALAATGFAASFSAVNMMAVAKTYSSVPRTTLVSGAIPAVATLTDETWPDMTAGSLDIYVLLSKVA